MSSKIIRRDVLVGVAVSAVTLAISVNGSRASNAKSHNIKIKSFEFEPEHIVVEVGDIIRWTNEDLAPHTATAAKAGWDTGEIVKGETKYIAVTENMETQYFCAFHPHMKGTIEVI